jgi:putative oxidoreductase
MKTLINRVYGTFPHGRAGLALLVVRVVFGAAFVLHGLGKIQAPFSWMGPDAPVPGFLQALAALSEFGGGIALILGLLTPLAALGLLGTMTFALGMVHLPMGHPFVAAEPGGPSFELALVYWSLSLLMILVGPGAYSVDAMLFNANRPSRLTPSYS